MAHHPIEDSNTSSNEHFAEVLAQINLSRRSIICGGVGLFAVGSLPMLAGCGGGGGGNVVEKKLGFNAMGKSIADSVVLPAGYTFSVLHATGDRLVSSIPAYSNQGTEVDDWSQRVGDHHARQTRGHGPLRARGGRIWQACGGQAIGAVFRR